MNPVRSRTLAVALAAAMLVTLLPLAASAAAAPCTISVAARTPEARADLWRGALESFSAERALSAEQRQFIAEAFSLGDEIAALKQDDREHAAFVRKAARIMEQSRELFSQNERGALFSAMGDTQIWMASLVAALPICNCTGTGPCQAAAGGPVGECKAGCESWDGTDGRRRDGVCMSTAVATVD